MNAAQLVAVLQLLCFMTELSNTVYLGKMDLQHLVAKLYNSDRGLMVKHLCKIISGLLHIVISEHKVEVGSEELAMPAGVAVENPGIIWMWKSQILRLPFFFFFHSSN